MPYGESVYGTNIYGGQADADALHTFDLAGEFDTSRDLSGEWALSTALAGEWDRTHTLTGEVE